jgi:TatD DNase family protein
MPDPTPIGLVDVHAHMADEAFSHDLHEVLKRAAAAGVKAILAVSETAADAERNLILAERFPLIKSCAGLHPACAHRDRAEEMFAFIHSHHHRLVAIGEVGLDYWQGKTPEDREFQRYLLQRQIGLARQYDLPLNVHSRSAGRHAIACLIENGAERVLLHAFDGKAASALGGLEAGYYFSIPPSIIRSSQKQKLVRHLPLDRLLLESDAPVLGPARDERNEPNNVRIACQQIADIKGLTFEDVARRTTENAERLFPRAF